MQNKGPSFHQIQQSYNDSAPQLYEYLTSSPPPGLHFFVTSL